MTDPAQLGSSFDLLETGVPGLDTILDGGIPRKSFNIVAGTPGSGKTTLTHQVVHHLGTAARPALYVTILGEPSVKMLGFQSRFAFFDVDAIGRRIHYLNLSHEVLRLGVTEVVDRILARVDELQPGVVAVDSFRSFARLSLRRGDGSTDLPREVERLALGLATSDATTFLVGEYPESETRSNPVFTVADGVLWLYQPVDDNSATRQLQVVKMRGTDILPGLHTLRISDEGVRIFPRGYREQAAPAPERFTTRQSFGVPELDEMLGGGVPRGEAVVLSGPSGSGKSTAALQFAGAGLESGESVVLAVFEERPEGYARKAENLGLDLSAGVEAGRAEVIYLRGLDLSVDETLHELYEAVKRTDAARVVIDSLSGLKMALAPTYKVDFRETLYNLSAFITDHGPTLFMTLETPEHFDGLQFTEQAISLVADTLISQRYVEVDSRLDRVINVVKMRHSDHSRELRRYEVREDGLHIGEPLVGYGRLMTGIPVKRDRDIPPSAP